MISVSLLNIILYTLSIVTYASSTMSSSVYRRVKISDIILIGITLIMYGSGLFGQYQIQTYSYITIVQLFSFCLLVFHFGLGIFYFRQNDLLVPKQIILMFSLWLIWTLLGIATQIILLMP